MAKFKFVQLASQGKQWFLVLDRSFDFETYKDQLNDFAHPMLGKVDYVYFHKKHVKECGTILLRNIGTWLTAKENDWLNVTEKDTLEFPES